MVHKVCILHLSLSSGTTCTLKYISKCTEYTDSLGIVVLNSYEISRTLQ